MNQVAAIANDGDSLRYVPSGDYWRTAWEGLGYGVRWAPTSGVRLESSNVRVASISKSGVLRAKKKGRAIVTATVGGSELKVKLTIAPAKRRAVALTKLHCYGHFRNYMSYGQFKKAYGKAVRELRPFLDCGRKTKLYGVAYMLRIRFDSKMTYSTKAAHYNDPYGYLIKNTASCAGCSRTSVMCLNILGVSAEHVHENRWCHQWARVKMGSAHWICDAYGLYVGKEPGKYKHPRFQ